MAYEQPFLSLIPTLESEVDRWLDHWPPTTRDALRRRVSQSNREVVFPALLELYTHEVLRTRFAELQYEPEVTSGTRPEFLAYNSEQGLMVECKVVFDEQPVRFATRELNRLVSVVNGINSDYDIMIQPTGRLTTQITPRKVEAFLKRELSKLTSPQVGQTLEFRDEKTATSVHFVVMDQKGADEETVAGWWTTGDIAQNVTTDERIMAGIEEKASRYGKPEMPFIIIIWPETEFPAHRQAIERALFGQLLVHVGKEGIVGTSRKANGAFTRRRGDGTRIHTRISAVGIYSLHLPIGKAIHEHRFALFHNPLAV